MHSIYLLCILHSLTVEPSRTKITFIGDSFRWFFARSVFFSLLFHLYCKAKAIIFVTFYRAHTITIAAESMHYAAHNINISCKCCSWNNRWWWRRSKNPSKIRETKGIDGIYIQKKYQNTQHQQQDRCDIYTFTGTQSLRMLYVVRLIQCTVHNS